MWWCRLQFEKKYYKFLKIFLDIYIQLYVYFMQKNHHHEMLVNKSLLTP